MHFRKFAGLAMGLVLAVGVAGTALATNWIGPNTVAPLNAGYNTPIWAEHTNASSIMYNHYCASTSYDATHPGSYSGVITWQWMHHWPFFPSTGLGNAPIPCYYSSTWYNVWQAVQSGVDYSVEYISSNLYTNTYELSYP